MTIKSISVRENVFGKLVLTVTEDWNYGDDWNGMPNSLSKTRTRDATPFDLVSIITNNLQIKLDT